MVYIFADYEFDTEQHELRQAGTPLPMSPQVFVLLAYLIQHRERAISKQELLEQVWPQAFVSEAALTTCIKIVRRTLGDTGRKQHMIKTVYGHGYRFIASVEESPSAATEPAPAGEAKAEISSVDHVVRPLNPAKVSIPPVALAHTNATPNAIEPRLPPIERRQLTVLVARVTDLAAAAESLGPEALGPVIGEAHAVCAQVIQRFAGHLVQSHGEELMAYFGYPQAHEDGAHRAVHAALEILQDMTALNARLEATQNIQLTVRIGLHTGVTVVGAIDSGDTQALLALGTPLTLAAQLPGLAAPNTVVISGVTWQMIEGHFVCQCLDHQIRDECAQPLRLYQVLRESGVQSRFEGVGTQGLTPFVGREAELGLLQERWQQVMEGRGQVVLLGGEAGMGKSRLVEAFQAAVKDIPHSLIVCHGSPYHQQPAFAPVIGFLHRLLRFRADELPQSRLRKLERLLAACELDLPEIVPLVAALLSLPAPACYPSLHLTPQQQQQQLLEALLSWLLKEAEWRPVYCIVEDLQWVDPSTLELLHLCVERSPSCHLFLVLLFRPDFQPSWSLSASVTYLTLNPLDQSQARGMITQLTRGHALPADIREQLVDKTDGVPLFLEACTKAVLAADGRWETEGHEARLRSLSPLAIPATLQDSLTARLDRLGSAKEVAQMAAAIGREFTYEVLTAVTHLPLDALEAALHHLVEAECLVQRGHPPHQRYRFKHALVQEAAYASLLKHTRQQLHSRIALALAESAETVSR